MMQRRRADRGETADETLDRRIAEVQAERQRARSVPSRTEDGPGVRRLELAAPGPREEAQPGGRGIPQALGPPAVTQPAVVQPADVRQQQPMREGGEMMPRPLAAGQFLWGTLQDAAGAVGAQLQTMGLSPGERGRPQVPQGDPSALLPLQAEPCRGNGSDSVARDGVRPGGGHGGGMLGPLSEPLPQQLMLRPRSLEQTYQQMGTAAVPPQPANPFWSAAIQREALGLADTSQLGPREGSQVMVTPVRQVQAATAAVSSVPAQVVSPAPAVGAAASVSQDPVRPAGLAVSPVPEVAGHGGGSQVVDPAVLAVEEIRRRVMREAEEAFAREMQKLQAPAEETQSYQTASSGMDGGPTSGGQQGVPGGSWVWMPEGRGQSSPQPTGRPPTPPPGIPSGVQAASLQSGTSLTEALRNLELPKLPTPGSPDASLLFGDWMTVVYPIMCDVAGSAREWWTQTVGTVEHHYVQWLSAAPLEKLRMKPENQRLAEQFSRLEQRGISMLLGCMAETLRQDVIASRRLSAVGILFRLFTTYQPGGTGERTSLIRGITDVKVPTGLVETLAAIRLWRRSVGRSEELRVTVDPLVLTGVLAKFAEGTAKLGGNQVAFRLATMRQQLDVDRTPQLDTVKEWAEYIQAELEELANAQAVPKAATSGQTASGVIPPVVAPAVKALTGDGSKPWERKDGAKAPCRFWGTEEGCRRGEKCGFAHDWGTLERSSRCLLCSSTGHRKKDCPTVKPKEGNGGQKAEKKIAKVHDSKGQKGSGKDSRTQEGGSSEGTDPPTEKPVETPKPKQEGEAVGGLVQNLSGLVKSMSTVKSLFLKTVKVDGDETAEYALLDGGATHALRQAKASEVPHLWPVQVEMAMGSVTLYKCPWHNTLLALEGVEPIIPLRLLVDRGFKIEWGRQSCDISHPQHGRLDCVMRQGCPVMDRTAALQLLDSLERNGVGDAYAPAPQEVDWWKERYPLVPDRIWSLMRGQGVSWDEIEAPMPWNRRKRRRLERAKGGVVLHLFAGRGSHSEKWQSLGGTDTEVLTLDIAANPHEDVHSASVWAYLWSLAGKGRIRMITADPPNRTVHRLRSNGTGPKFLRGRAEARFSLAGLSEKEMIKLDGDTALWLKVLGLHEKSQEGMENACIPGRCGLFVESPQDPAEYLEDGLERNYPSFWEWVETKDFMRRQSDVFKIQVDQGALGYPKPKPTTLMTNMAQLRELDGVKVSTTREEIQGDLCERRKHAALWSSWAAGLVESLKIVIPRFLQNQSQQPALKKLDLEGWKNHLLSQHVPYRRDCRVCLETMGSAEPHRRKKGQESAFVMSADICGPFTQGTDLGVSKRRKVKYALIATIPVPKWPVPGEKRELEPKAPGEEDEKGKDPPPESDHGPPIEGLEDLLEDPEPKELVSEEVAKKKNQAWKDFLKKEARSASEEIPVENVTFMEPIASREPEEVLTALSKIHARARSLGIPVYRLHTDRERAFATKGITKWCLDRKIFQSMNAGDEPEGNGRVEGEVLQFKRRLRLLLAETGVNMAYWPCAARHGSEVRLRSQLRKLGAKCKEMPRFAVMAQVKAKRWHRLQEGVLASPYKTLRIMGPSPSMTNGWVAFDEAANRVQHARSVFVPDPLGETARLELEAVEDPAVPSRRLYGKQPLSKEVEKVPQPPARVAQVPAQGELEAPGAHSVVREMADVIIPELELDEPEDDYEPSLADDLDVAPVEEVAQPALTALRAGGESLAGGGESLAGDGDQVQGWGEIDVSELPGFVDELRFQHWNSKKFLLEQLSAVAGNREEGAALGVLVQHVNSRVHSLERDLEYYSKWEEKEIKIAALTAAGEGGCPKIAAFSTEVPGEGGNEGCSKGQKPPTVLQTYTVPLAMVKADLEAWLEPIKAEYRQLTQESRAVRPVTVKELEAMEGYQTMELAPSKLVTTVKSPNGKHKARIVICGNLVTKAHEDGNRPQTASVPAADLYAGGADATAIRCMVRKTAMMEGWDMGVVDIKGAFLLAPRRRERECLMMTIPPKLLVQAGICPPDERWVIQKAMYGLETSPADWSAFRDSRVRKFAWNANGRMFWMRQTVEPNVWQILSSEEPSRGDSEERVEGFCTFYVDDVLVCGPPNVIKGCLDRMTQEWSCSPAEYLSEKGSLRFCGMELKLSPEGGILLSQESYTSDLLERYPEVKESLVPIGRLDDSEESPPDPADVRRAQTLVGELLWLSTKTRPDIAYAVSWLGSRASKCPRKVCQAGLQTLGYLKRTLGHGLLYKKCQEADRGPDGKLAFCRDANTLEVHSDASFGPGGERSHQGLLAVWAGGLIQWESKRQSFATLSSSEAEVTSYVDGMCLGDSVAVLVDIFEEGRLTEKGIRVLYGDSQSGIQVVLNPNGPWRSRHLRLRSRALHEAVQQEVWKLKHMAGVELAADFLTKPITVGATWARFRTFVGLYDLAEPEDVEILKKIAICKDWALKGLQVAVELEKWNPSVEEHKTVREVGICAVATGICHVVQRWKHHLCCLKRKRTPREDEPGNLTGEAGNPGTTGWLRENEPSSKSVKGPHVKKGWLRENEPSSQPPRNMPRENEPGIKPTNGHHQGPNFSGVSVFGESCFGDGVACSFSSGRRDQVNGPVCSTDFGSSDHCPTGCPGLSRRVCALRAGAMDAAPGLAAGGAGGDGGKDGGDWPDKSWVEPHRPSEGYYEKKKRKRKKKNKAKKGQPEEPEMGAEPGEEPTRPNIWFEGSLNSDARQGAMDFRRERQMARNLQEAEADDMDLDQEHDPDQALPHEELEAGGVPEPKTPPPGYKPPPKQLQGKLMPTAKGMPIPPKQGAPATGAVGSAAALPPEASAVDSAATASSSPMVPSAASAMTTLPSPMAPAPDRPEGLVTYSVRTFEGLDREVGYFTAEGERVPRLQLNRDGVLVPAVADGQQEDGEEEEEEEDDAETNTDRDPPGRDPPDRDPPGDGGGGASGPPGPPGPGNSGSSDENWGQWKPRGKDPPEPEGEPTTGTKTHPVMVKAMRLPSSTTRPWENVEFAAPPPEGGKDRWRLDLAEGWVVRCHREPRRRAFHPVHKAAPHAASSLEPMRVTVGFVGGERFKMEDQWADAVRDLGKGRWTGWTFFKLKVSEPTSVPTAAAESSPGDDVLRGGEGHHSLLPDRPDGDGRAAGPDGGMYASLASSTTAAEMTPATGYAGGRGLLHRAQPVVADLHRRDGPGPDEEVLSEGWSELSSA